MLELESQSLQLAEKGIILVDVEVLDDGYDAGPTCISDVAQKVTEDPEVATKDPEVGVQFSGVSSSETPESHPNAYRNKDSQDTMNTDSQDSTDDVNLRILRLQHLEQTYSYPFSMYYGQHVY